MWFAFSPKLCHHGEVRLCGWLLLTLALMGYPARVLAAAECAVTISPLGLPVNTTNIAIQFTLTNSGTETLRSAEIELPVQEELTYTTDQVNNWTVQDNGNAVSYMNGEISPG